MKRLARATILKEALFDPMWDEGWRRLVPRVWVDLLFEPRDAWIGLYWDRPDVLWDEAIDFYVCVVPFLPIKVMWRRLKE